MITLLFKIATIVTLVFMLIASLRAGSAFLDESWLVWLACGLLALFFALFFAPWVDAELNSTQNPPPPGA